jgi:hypothetical protein
MLVMIARRRAVLTAALAFLQLPPRASELQILHRWADSWRGVRWIAREMRAEGHSLTVKRNAAGWTATFTYVGKSKPAAGGSLWSSGW